MRHMLASIILRLLGNRLVYEDAVMPFCPGQSSPHKRDVGEMLVENQSIAASEFPGESLFDRLLLILHGLLSSSQPSWLKSKHVSTTAHESARGFCGFEKEVAESLQVSSFLEVQWWLCMLIVHTSYICLYTLMKTFDLLTCQLESSGIFEI